MFAPLHPEANERFYNTIFRILLLMKFNKVSITLSPLQTLTLGQGAQCHAENPDTRFILRSEKVTNNKQT